MNQNTRLGQSLCAYGPHRYARINIKAVVILAIVTILICSSLIVGYKVRKRIIANNALAAGNAAFEQSDWPEAATQLKLYLSKYPNDVKHLRRCAEAYMQIRPQEIKHIVTAIAMYRRVLRFEPDDVAVCEELVRLYNLIGDSSEVAYVCRQWLEATPGNCEASMALGRALISLGKEDEAKSLLVSLVDKHPDEVDAFMLLYHIDLKGQSPDASQSAVAWLNKAIEHNPQSASAFAYRAWFQFAEKRDRQAALQDLEKADSLGSTNPKVMLLMCDLWFNYGDLDRAEAQLKTLDGMVLDHLDTLQTDPDYIRLLKNIAHGRILLLRGDANACLALADRALEELRNRHRSMFLPTAVELYLASDQLEKAQQCLAEFEEVVSKESAENPALVDQLNTARAAIILHDRDQNPFEARLLLEEIVMREPRHPQAWKLLGTAYSRTHQRGRALAALEQYLALVPGDVKTAITLARQYLQQNHKKALRYAKHAEELAPTNLDAILARISAAMAAADEGQADVNEKTKLQDELQTLLQQNPTSGEVRRLLAKLAANEGDTDQAISQLETVIDTCDDKFAASINLYMHAKKSGRMDKAAQAARKAIELRADSAIPRILLADVQATTGHTKEAQATLQTAVATLVGQEKLTAQAALAQTMILHEPRSEGIELLKQLAIDHPKNAVIRLGLLKLPEVNLDEKLAQKLIDELREIEGRQGTLWPLEQAKFWFRKDKWKEHKQEIIDLMTQCLKSNAFLTQPVILLGNLYEKMGNYQLAEQTYREGIKTLPEQADIATQLITMLEYQRRFVDAQEVLESLSPALKLQLQPYRVDISMGLGNIEKAIEQLEDWKTQAPENPTPLVLLARLVYLHLQDVNSAMKYLDEAEILSPHLLLAVSTRAEILQQEGRYDDAVAMMNAEVSRRQDFAGYLARAEFFTHTGKLELAEKDYQHLASFKESSAEAYIFLGRFYESHQRLDDAIHAWDKGASINPESLELKRYLVSGLLNSEKSDDREKGQAMLNALLAQSKDDPDLLLLQASALARQRSPESKQEAIAVLKRVVELAPAKADAQLLLARLLMETQNGAAAAECVRTALASNPNHSALMLLQAKIEMDLGHEAVARQLATQALANNPKDIRILALMVDLSLRQHDIPSAQAHYKTMEQWGPKQSLTWLARAALFMAEGKKTEAIGYLEKQHRDASKAGADDLNVLLKLAELCIQTRDFESAQKWLDEASKIDHANFSVFQTRLQLLAAQGKFDEIEKQIDPAILQFPDQKNKTLFIIANLLASSGEQHCQKAKALLERLIKSAPSHVAAFRLLAGLMYRLGDVQACEQANRSVLTIDPYHADALNDLAWILGNVRGKPEEALELANKGVLRHPNHPHLLDTRGQLLLQAGQLDQARTDLEECLSINRTPPTTKMNALLNLARLSLKEDKIEEAKTRLNEAENLGQATGTLSPEHKAEIQQIRETLGH